MLINNNSYYSAGDFTYLISSNTYNNLMVQVLLAHLIDKRKDLEGLVNCSRIQRVVLFKMFYTVTSLDIAWVLSYLGKKASCASLSQSNAYYTTM